MKYMNCIEYSKKGGVLIHKTSLTSPLFINMPGKWAVMYVCARCIDFVYFYDFSIGFLELFQQCGIFRTVPTVWYF